MDESRTHEITVSVGGNEIPKWTEYEFGSSMVEPSSQFTLSRAFTSRAIYETLRMDAEVKVKIDGVVKLVGYIDSRDYSGASGTLTIGGRDKAGRLVQESVPQPSGWDGLLLTDLVAKLVKPYYNEVTLSDAQNRTVARGRGHKAPAAGEPALFSVKGRFGVDRQGNAHTGRVDPGEMRWNVIEQVTSSVEILAWPTADGKKIVIGKPNYAQAIQYIFRKSNTIDIKRTESILDMYSVIEAYGVARGDDGNFGESVTSCYGIAKDGPGPNGIGKNFIRSKRLAMSQRGYESNAEADRAASRELARRSFKREIITVISALHGQRYGSPQITLYQPNTLGRVVIEEAGVDGIYLIFAAKFSGGRSKAEQTELQLVPKGTVFTA